MMIPLRALILSLVCLSAAQSTSSNERVVNRGSTVTWSPLNDEIPHLSTDPVESVGIRYPLNGAVEKLPLVLSVLIRIRPDGGARLTEEFRNKQLCVEMRKDNQVAGQRQCARVGDREAKYQLDELGNFTAIAYITEGVEAQPPVMTPTWQSNVVTFSTVSDEDFSAFIARQINEQGLAYPGFDIDLISWARQTRKQSDEWTLKQLQEDHDLYRHSNQVDGGDLLLVVGIKTAVATNFPIRQAIRSTWASKEHLPATVKVFFLGCRPFTEALENQEGADSFHRQLWSAIQLEKLMYGDLLTDELDCDDTYSDLAQKVTEFLYFTTTRYAQAQYVMIADDDIYVRIDEVTRQLQDAPRQRYHSGQVRAIENLQKEKPIRSKGTSFRYELSNELYPMSDLPPFAIGAYVFLSMDCAEFIAKNRKRLRDLAGMDDMSISLWMLALQVHPQPFGRLEHLRGGPCANNLYVLGDLSPLSLRVVHDNILYQRQLCHGFDRYTWLKPRSLSRILTDPLADFRAQFQFASFLRDEAIAFELEVVTTISTPVDAGVKVSYFPTMETQHNYLQRVCVIVRLYFAGVAGTLSCSEIGQQALRGLQTCYNRIADTKVVDPSRMELWRYNLFDADVRAAPLVVAYAASTWFSRIVLECLFVSVFHKQKRPLVVVPEHILLDNYGTSPDVFVFSVLGGKCNPLGSPACQQLVASYLKQYASGDTPAQLVILALEAWKTDGLDNRVLLLSAVAAANRPKHVHLSVASASFGERRDHGPLALLSTASSPAKTRFCAYLYARCEQSDRELMYDLLNALRPVDALGKCAGSSRAPDVAKEGSRNSPWYNDDAVRQFGPYKFVLAFENSRAGGYVTEKLVNAFLAGSVPVYWGNTTTVSELFNPNSFIDCGRFSSLNACAAYVAHVDDSPDLYERLRREVPVTNISAFYQAFSWHPSVPSRFLADEVLQKFLI